MIDDWDVPATKPGTSGDSTEVVAIVPLTPELGGDGEILVQSAFGNLQLPGGAIQQRETSLKAVVRVVLGMTGVRVKPERLLYVIERPQKPITLGILCGLVDG